MMLEAELRSEVGGRLIKAGPVPQILRDWREMTKRQGTVLYVVYDGKIYSGDAVEKLCECLSARLH
jgi:hypothetical protein